MKTRYSPLTGFPMMKPFKNHYEMLRGLIDKYHPEPMDEAA